MYGNILLLFAASVLVIMGVVHSYLGERFVFRRLFRLENLPLLRNDRRYTENVLRYAWHLTSVTWWAFAACLVILWAMANNPGPTIAKCAALLCFISGATIVATAGVRHPAWSLFLLAGVLAWLGSS
jgi:hypothetical protein